MASQRRPLHGTSKLNFRPGGSFTPDLTSCDFKGKRPLPEPTTVQHVFLMMVLHVCRKTIFLDTNIKVGVYGASLFIISLIADVLPIPKTYFATSDNFLNQYFVKLGWGWTLLVTFPFIVLTSYTYCCGKQEKMAKHVMRLGISTFSWFFWIRLFHYIESNYGRCIAAKGGYYTNKSSCVASGSFWSGFDISGHAFILIYSSLVMIEEARAIIGWEGIRDIIRNEEHARNIGDKSTRPLHILTAEEFSNLKHSYRKFTPYIRSLFIAMTCLTILWDCMLVSTMLYYHVMIEKFISGGIAILMWFVTYRYWYTLPRVMPNLPGEGMFKYKDVRQQKELPVKKKGPPPNPAKGQLPTFMGMPLYGLRKHEGKDDKDKEDSQNNENETSTSNKVTIA